MARVPDHDDEERDDAPRALREIALDLMQLRARIAAVEATIEHVEVLWSDDALTRCRLCGWWIYVEGLGDPVCAWCAAGRDPVPTPPHGTSLLWIDLESLERPERP